MAHRVPMLAAILFGLVSTAGAQQSVRLEFKEGSVTLTAQNAPVRTILAEWARVGGATIVNGDRVTGPPVTLELRGVPERQALDIVLRGVSGYMIAPRPAGSSGASAFDRILILPTSAAPRNPAPPASTTTGRPVVPRPPILARPPAAVEPPADEVETDDPEAGEETETTPQPQRSVDPRILRPAIQPNRDRNAEETEDTTEPDDSSPGGVAPTPSNPFGIPAGSSATPGTVAPAQRPGSNRVQ